MKEYMDHPQERWNKHGYCSTFDGNESNAGRSTGQYIGDEDGHGDWDRANGGYGGNGGNSIAGSSCSRSRTGPQYWPVVGYLGLKRIQPDKVYRLDFFSGLTDF